MTLSNNPVNAPMSALLDCAHVLADRAGDVILKQFRRQMQVENKEPGTGFDPVTAADRAAERVIRKTILERFPAHGVLGEEFGLENPTARYRWVIDPIDGTRSFIMGSPMWGTLIGLLDDGEAVLGLIDHPFTGERYWSDSKHAYRNSGTGRTQKIKTRQCSRIEDAILSTTHPDLFQDGTEAKGFERLKAKARMTRYGGDCYGYGLLAAGHVDLIAEVGLKTYDVVALIPVIEKAGGRITDWSGKPATEGGRILASGDPLLHDKALKLLNA